MRTSVTRFVLEKLRESGEVTLDAFFPRHYSYTRVSRSLFGVAAYPKVSPRTLATILSRLKRQGLIARRQKSNASIWSLTKRGRVWLNNKKRLILAVPPPDGIARIVAFDIPERERKKRDTVRAELVMYNFKQLQKSVWLGYNPLPEDFTELLDELHLGNKVHIFSIREKGTIEET